MIREPLSDTMQLGLDSTRKVLAMGFTSGSLRVACACTAVLERIWYKVASCVQLLGSVLFLEFFKYSSAPYTVP